MRRVCFYDQELREIKDFFMSMVGKSSHGIFYSIGQIIGRNIAKEALHDKENYFEVIKQKIKERNFADDIEFGRDTITVFGSAEVTEGLGYANCDILRGILLVVYEFRQDENSRLYCEEIGCASSGGDKCVFKIESNFF
ncbi:MAG TPA: hypothetical protein EYP86_03440 [Candidatus Altiarchaeales archaeon]|nr:hypothetical protein [Candidatus Altiarchaeales archaeon]